MSNTNDNKIQYFEYFIEKLYVFLGNNQANDLNIVKTQKLLYFLINSVKDSSDNYPLLNKFDKFFALPYGHVESEIYKAIKGEEGFKLLYFNITRFGTKRKDAKQINLSDKYTDLIEEGFVKLIDYNLITRNASYLVDLSHCHDSWIKNYREALRLNKNIMLISKDDLTNEQKYFSL